MFIIINGILLFLICIGVMAIILKWLRTSGWLISNLDYVCSKCGGYIYLPTWQAVTSFHFMGRKWVRCPHCGQMTWAIPIRDR
jgi:DNA-directed RNA polymerase subunit RPC12/RpoP